METNMVTVRYESSINSFLTRPFEIGLRHLKVGFCDGSPNTLLQMARERIIYRTHESKVNFDPLTKKQRVFHILTGALETVGYITLITPFVVSILDRIFNKPWYPKGGYPFRTHMEEGGSSNYAIEEESNLSAVEAKWRKNPFDANGKNDPFYEGASWVKA